MLNDQPSKKKKKHYTDWKDWINVFSKIYVYTYTCMFVRKIEAAHEFERDQERVDGRSWSSGPQPF